MVNKSDVPEGDSSLLDDHLNPDADTLAGKVQWMEMFGRFFRSTLVAVASIVTGAVLAVRGTLVGLYEDVWDAGDAVWSELIGFPQEIQNAAIASATRDILSSFDLLAGPVALVVTLVGVGMVTFIIWLFLGGDS